MKMFLTGSFLVLFFLQGFAQHFEQIVIEADTAHANITYGTVIRFRYHTITKKGKEKDVPYHKVREYIACAATGANWEPNDGTLTFPLHTADKGLVKAKLEFISTKPDVDLSQKMEINMNFKDPVFLDYSGTKGTPGISGDSKGTPLLFRDGKAGDSGGNGGNGGKGNAITVRCKKEYDDFFKREIVFLYVKDDSLQTESIFRCPKPEAGIRISVSGGNGGDGGAGGNGGNGKNGLAVGNENKLPGNAGQGGNGGNGGNGGPGGKVTVIAHTNCSDILSYLNIENFGGKAGNAGRAGNAGTPGTPAPGQGSAKTANAGMMGNPGMAGTPGKPFELKVEDF